MSNTYIWERRSWLDGCDITACLKKKMKGDKTMLHANLELTDEMLGVQVSGQSSCQLPETEMDNQIQIILSKPLPALEYAIPDLF